MYTLNVSQRVNWSPPHLQSPLSRRKEFYPSTSSSATSSPPFSCSSPSSSSSSSSILPSTPPSSIFFSSSSPSPSLYASKSWQLSPRVPSPRLISTQVPQTKLASNLNSRSFYRKPIAFAKSARPSRRCSAATNPVRLTSSLHEPLSSTPPTSILLLESDIACGSSSRNVEGEDEDEEEALATRSSPPKLTRGDSESVVRKTLSTPEDFPTLSGRPLNESLPFKNLNIRCEHIQGGIHQIELPSLSNCHSRSPESSHSPNLTPTTPNTPSCQPDVEELNRSMLELGKAVATLWPEAALWYISSFQFLTTISILQWHFSTKPISMLQRRS